MPITLGFEVFTISLSWSIFGSKLFIFKCIKCRALFLDVFQLSFKLSSHQAILFGRYKLKLSSLLFPGDSDIFKAVFLYRAINFYHQLIPIKLILSPDLEKKKSFVKAKRWRAIFLDFSEVVLLLYHFLGLVPWLFLSSSLFYFFFFEIFFLFFIETGIHLYKFW